MATVDQWAAAQNNGQNPVQATGQGDNGLSGAQQSWANQYVNSLQAGNSDPQELSRYLSYQALIPQLNNLNQTTSAGYTGSNITEAQKQWYQNYNKQIQQGTNNLGQLDQYNGYANILFGGQKAKPSDEIMRQLSIGALNGDRGAQGYLSKMGLTPWSGSQLWNGVDPTKDPTQFGSFETGGYTNASNQYMQDNPYSSFTKGQNMDVYNQYSNIIKNNGQLDNNQESIYNDLIGKWNLRNMNDPYNKNIDQMQTDKQNALNAQDVALNQTMGALDSKNFQNMQTAQQSMNNRGMGDSGFAQDAYNQATMAANQDYQKAFADAATQKSSLATNYDTAIGKMQTDQLANQQAQQQQLVANQQNAIKEQNAQDQFLTTQSGYIYIGGKPVISNGQPITTLDWQKMSETARHDMATEALTQQQNNNTYNLGVMNNQTAQQANMNTYNLGIMNNNTANAKIQADLSMKQQQLQLDWANYGLNSQKTQSSIDSAIASAKTAAQNSDNTAFKDQANAVASELSTLKDRMNAYVNKGQPVPNDLQSQFNSTLGKYQGLIGTVGN